MTLHSGERQVATRVNEIRKDHIERYKWASEMMEGCIVLDIGCGVGYGAPILQSTGNHVFGIDNDPETIEFANEHFRFDGNVEFVVCDVMKHALPNVDHDVVTCFEVIEHLMDPRDLLKNLSQTTGMLFASVPNEDGFKFTGQQFHHRHYTKAEFEALLNECGWRVTEWWGQEGIDSEVKPNLPNSRTLIAIAVPGWVESAIRT